MILQDHKGSLSVQSYCWRSQGLCRHICIWWYCKYTFNYEVKIAVKW